MPFHFNSTLLGNGSVIRPGNWGRIVRFVGSGHPEWTREQKMEQIRQAEFPSLPSRWDCIFYFEDLIEAKFYQTSLGANCILLLYEVEIVDPSAPKHVADWKGTGPYDSDEWARRYWRGDVMPGRGPAPIPLCREALAMTPLRIVREL